MSEANCGISVHEVTQVRVSDSEGNAMNQGDTIVLRIDTEDILCVFKGIESGYFITETCEDGIRNRYRVKSIKKSKVVKNASVDAADEEEYEYGKSRTDNRGKLQDRNRHGGDG